jgi:hypothetical protein
MDREINFIQPGFQLKTKVLPKLTTAEAAAAAKDAGK